MSACVCLLLGAGCNGGDQQRTLDAVQLGMTSDMEPSYESGEDKLYEVKRAVPFPIAAPSDDDLAALGGKAAPPFPRYPFLSSSDVKVQVSWTLSNLDEDDHDVRILIDPWNEFGRYVPGLAVVNANEGKLAPNLSGIDVLHDLPGTKSARSSRMHGVFTFEDMNELAIDFATVMNIIANPPPAEGDEDPTVGLVNHAFAVEQRTPNDVLSKPFIPKVIPGLTGIDVGLRTTEPANVAIEIVVEVVDRDSGKVLEKGSSKKQMAAPTEVVTIAYSGM